MIPKGWRDWAFEAAEREKAKWPRIVSPAFMRDNYAMLLSEAQSERRFHEWAREERHKDAERVFAIIGNHS